MTTEQKYQEALNYLYSFVDYSLTRQLRYSPEKFDLGRMVALLQKIGNPHQGYPIIHVAGTKGKGSTSAFIASALQSAGFRTGFYTSPHLQDYTERIQISQNQITHDELWNLVEIIKPAVAEVNEVTTFEITTALAFMHFKLRQVDVAVVEVGLGGRLDATNVVDPFVTVITSISYDHMNVLGNTLSQIATEKAGIIKSGKPIVLAPQREEAKLVVESIAKERAARLVEVGRDYLFAPWSHALTGQSLLVWPMADQPLVTEYIESGGRSTWEPVRLSIPLLGYHQVENAATAYAALQVARTAGLDISESAILEGFSQVVWPARFELLRLNPPLIIDSAHNRDSALKLRLALDDYMSDKPVILVFGASEDKDIAGMFAELLPRIKLVIATQSEHPRAMDPVQLVQLAHSYGKPAQVVVPIENALHAAIAAAGRDGVVLVTGSIFVAAAAREVWLKSLPTAQQVS